MTVPESLIHPFRFLRHAITVLVVDDKPDELSELIVQLSKIEFFNVIGAGSAREAVDIFQDKRVHVCLTELSIRDINDDPFFLSGKYSSRTRFVGITGIKSCSLGYQAIRNGFSDIFDKPVDPAELVRYTFRNAMLNIFVPHSKPLHKSAIDRTVDVLMEHSPATVDRWASDIGITTCTLREQWDKLGIPPKAVLFIWTLFNVATEYSLENMVSCATYWTNDSKADLFQKLRDMYFLKRCYWLDIINGGRGVEVETIFFGTVTASSRRVARKTAVMTAAC